MTDQKVVREHLKVALPGTMVGEVAFFLDTTRTATVVNGANNRVCLLPKRDEVFELLRCSCRRLLQCMHQQVYSYVETDSAVREKVVFLRNSVPYFKDVEEKALIEIAFQMRTQLTKKGELVHRQHSKVKDLVVVFDGALDLLLPRRRRSTTLDTLRRGSSLGQYSGLDSRGDGPNGRLIYLVKSVRHAHLWRISRSLLQRVRRHHGILD